MKIKLIVFTVIMFSALSSCSKEADVFKQKIPLSKINYDYYFSTPKHEDVNFSIISLGDINISTGEIIVCDPLVCLGDTSPFTKKIKPGSYPVQVCVAKNAEMGTRYAFAKMVISENKAFKWELAITDEVKNKISELNDDEYFGFPVDAGLGSFCDNKTQEMYVKFEKDFLKNKKDANMYDDFFADKFKENAIDKNDPNDIGDWLNFSLPGSNNNIVMFHSGYGDGYYPAYWGYDSEGNTTALVIDFMLFGYE